MGLGDSDSSLVPDTNFSAIVHGLLVTSPWTKSTSDKKKSPQKFYNIDPLLATEPFRHLSPLSPDDLEFVKMIKSVGFEPIKLQSRTIRRNYDLIIHRGCRLEKSVLVAESMAQMTHN